MTYPPREVAITVRGVPHPVHLRLGTTDLDVLVQVFNPREVAIPWTRSPRVIVDAGANIGLTTIYYASRYPQARVLAIEPEARNFALLAKNARPYPNVVPLQAALWSADTRLVVIDPGLGFWGFQTANPSAHTAGAPRQEVAAITLGRLMRQYDIGQIDLLKVDIEGSEKEVFESIGPWLGRVGVILIELHDRLKMGCSRSFYNATKDFDFERREGEKVLVARNEYVPHGFLRKAA